MLGAPRRSQKPFCENDRGMTGGPGGEVPVRVEAAGAAFGDALLRKASPAESPYNTGL